jgi:hypothetical protein
MLGTSVRRSSRRSMLASAALAVPIAGLLAAVVVIAVPVGGPASGVTGSSGPALIGEHSALGERRVDELNAAIASMQRAKGEHAGLSRTDYEAEASLD